MQEQRNEDVHNERARERVLKLNWLNKNIAITPILYLHLLSIIYSH
jgi:hypothetical protein